MSVNSVLILVILVFLTVIFFMFPAADHMAVGARDEPAKITSIPASIAEKTTTNVDGIVNHTKKITGQTSHVKRVNFNDSAEVVKYNVESGKNVSINRVKLTDTNQVVARKLTSAVVKSGVIGSSEAIGIEDISAGILLL